MRCGTERWTVKILHDTSASRVDFDPQPTTVRGRQAMLAVAGPAAALALLAWPALRAVGAGPARWTPQVERDAQPAQWPAG